MGAELFGLKSTKADLEIINLMLETVALLTSKKILLSVSHVQVFKDLAKAAKLNSEIQEKIALLIRSKNISSLKNLMENLNLPHKQQELFLLLPELYGEGDTVLKLSLIHI